MDPSSLGVDRLQVMASHFGGSLSSPGHADLHTLHNSDSATCAITSSTVSAAEGAPSHLAIHPITPNMKFPPNFIADLDAGELDGIQGFRLSGNCKTSSNKECSNTPWLPSNADKLNSAKSTPFWDAGITGSGQILQISDTGLDIDNQYFWDSSSSCSTAFPRDKTSSSNLSCRKVVQYYAHVDAGDDEGGHGTHVVGSVLGHRSSNGGDNTADSWDDSNGMAKDARVAFYDIGQTGQDGLSTPSDLATMFDASYNLGARIHSASWGRSTNYITSNDMDIDDYMYDNDEYLVLSASARMSSTGGSETTYMAGTSMATPVAAGVAALVRDYFMQGFYPTGSKVTANARVPSGALVKAVMINGAKPLLGIQNDDSAGSVTATQEYDFNQGFGRIQLNNVLPINGNNDMKVFAIDGVSLSQSQSEVYTFKIDTASCSADELVMTLVWTDPASTGSWRCVSNCVYNDLDLKVQRSNGATIYPNGKSSRDNTDNVERVRMTVSNGETVTATVCNVALSPAASSFNFKPPVAPPTEEGQERRLAAVNRVSVDFRISVALETNSMGHSTAYQLAQSIALSLDTNVKNGNLEWWMNYRAGRKSGGLCTGSSSYILVDQFTTPSYNPPKTMYSSAGQLQCSNWVYTKPVTPQPTPSPTPSPPTGSPTKSPTLSPTPYVPPATGVPTPSPTKAPTMPVTPSPTPSPTTPSPTQSPTTSAPTPTKCTNGFRDGAETDVDCGGVDCGKCGIGSVNGFDVTDRELFIKVLLRLLGYDNLTMAVESANRRSLGVWPPPSSNSNPCGPSEKQVTLDMADSYGDGWNGAQLTITNKDTGAEVPGGPFTLANGNKGAASACVSPSTCYTVAVQEGLYANEVSWAVLDGNDVTLAEGGAPDTKEFCLGTDAPTQAPTGAPTVQPNVEMTLEGELRLDEYFDGTGSEAKYEQLRQKVLMIVKTGKLDEELRKESGWSNSWNVKEEDFSVPEEFVEDKIVFDEDPDVEDVHL
ncbi:hypothetical protein TrRE_jg11040 [Triparma retinervis]|uniref:subtilisin n=1 Tax=Triparma retinervis TaxID=2557542 RepID=A0A9W7KRQ6_9STRA|nr:hypothetical protein TrRE_jg11040 [Triparma retinervis]